jgi:hypothetical protein
MSVKYVLRKFSSWVMAQGIHLKKALKLLSVRINAVLDTFHNGSPNPVNDANDAGLIADSLTGIPNPKAPFVFNKSCIRKGFCFPTAKIKRIKIWRACRSFSVFPSVYPIVMIGVVENIFHHTPKVYWSTIIHVQYSLSYNLQIKCFRTHIWIFFLFCCVKLVHWTCPHVSITRAQTFLLSCGFYTSTSTSIANTTSYLLWGVGTRKMMKECSTS